MIAYNNIIQFRSSLKKFGTLMGPGLDHLHSVGPRPSHISFIVQSLCPHLYGNSSRLGTNVTIPNHLSYWAPLACEGTPPLNLGIMKVMSTWIFVFWPGIVTLVPNGREFPCKCGQEDHAVKEAWEGQGMAGWRCELAWALGWYICLCRWHLCIVRNVHIKL